MVQPPVIPGSHIGLKSMAEFMEVAGEDVSVVAAAGAGQEVTSPAGEGEPAAEVKSEGDRMAKMNTPKLITAKMTMTKRRVYLSLRSKTIIITLTILEPIIVTTCCVPPFDELPVDVIPSEPGATTLTGSEN